MKISEILASASKPTFSLEMLPVAGLPASENLRLYEHLLRRRPIFGDFPVHPMRIKKPSGSLKNDFFAEPDADALSKTLLQEYEIAPMVHLLCRDNTPETIEQKLMHLQDLGIENLLLLRGDATQEAVFPGHKFAYQLVEQVRDFNQGKRWSGTKIANQLTFDIGVGGYPEPVADGPGFAQTIRYLKQKTDAGASFIITQLFFDNQRFFAFENACRIAGIRVPIIPGICPLTSEKLLNRLPDFFKVSVPEVLQQEISKCTSPKMLSELGVAWALEQTRELLQNGFKSIHYFALAEPAEVEKVVKEFF